MTTAASIFDSPAASRTPTLGVNYMRASQRQLLVEFGEWACSLMARAPTSDPACCAIGTGRTSLTLEQRLDELGISGVVWDCGVAIGRLLEAHPVRPKRPMSTAVEQNLYHPNQTTLLCSIINQ